MSAWADRHIFTDSDIPLNCFFSSFVGSTHFCKKNKKNSSSSLYSTIRFRFWERLGKSLLTPYKLFLIQTHSQTRCAEALRGRGATTYATKSWKCRVVRPSLECKEFEQRVEIHPQQTHSNHNKEESYRSQAHWHTARTTVSKHQLSPTEQYTTFREPWQQTRGDLQG